MHKLVHLEGPQGRAQSLFFCGTPIGSGQHRAFSSLRTVRRELVVGWSDSADGGAVEDGFCPIGGVALALAEAAVASSMAVAEGL